MIDDIDREILTIIQTNARTPNAEIARRIGMAPSAVLERIRKLEERGVIQGYAARLDPEVLGYGVLAFVLVRTEGGTWGDDVGRALAALPEVQEVHHIAGEDCFLVKVRTKDTAALGTLLRERFKTPDGIRSTRTTIVLGTIKESGAIPVRSAPRESHQT